MQILSFIRKSGALILHHGPRILLGLVFIYASWDKIIDPAGFAKIIANYQILPPVLINPIALLLPWLELTCGIFLLVGWLVRGSALIITALLVIFMAALGYNLVRGLDVNCGCFSLNADAKSNAWLDLLRDVFFLILALLSMRRPVKWPIK